MTWALLLVCLLALGPAAQADEVTVHPPAVSVPLHSADDAFNRPASGRGPAKRPTARVTPYRTADPEALGRTREFLREWPQTLPPSPGFVEDGAQRPER